MTLFSNFRAQLDRFPVIVSGLLFFIGFVLVYFFLVYFIFSPDENEVSYINTNSNVLDLSIPANLDFCGEVIPTNDYEIKEDLKKEFMSKNYWKSNSVVFFNRAQRWFPYIEPILKQEGVPEDFKYLAVIESHLSNARSSAGAAGFWQLLSGSAINYGLEVNEYVDERFHVEKATRAACAHIKEAYALFGNWTLAAAAYNRGIGGIQAAMKNQKTLDYHELLLNKETGSFVYRILAYKTLLSSPTHFGLKKKKWSYYPKINYKVFKIDSSITDLTAFAKHLGVDESVIKNHNPWLRTEVLPNPEKKVYQIRVPKNQKIDYTLYINDLAVEGIEQGGGADQPDTAIKADSLFPPPGTKTLQIDNEISLEDLAKSYSLTADDLRKWNNIKLNQKTVKATVILLQEPETK